MRVLSHMFVCIYYIYDYKIIPRFFHLFSQISAKIYSVKLVQKYYKIPNLK